MNIVQVFFICMKDPLIFKPVMNRVNSHSFHKICLGFFGSEGRSKMSKSSSPTRLTWYICIFKDVNTAVLSHIFVPALRFTTTNNCS
jgi:hypothetical protein